MPTAIGIEILEEVKHISVSVGLPCPQDGDSRRHVSVSDADSSSMPPPCFFEQETEGLRSEEESLLEEVISALQDEGFSETNRMDSSETEGYHIWFERA